MCYYENRKTWQGNIGLITASEYIRANSDSNNCGSFYKLSIEQTGECRNTNWMYTKKYWWWGISPFSSSEILYIDEDGNLRSGNTYSNTFGARPVVNLKSGTVLSGKGTKENPYKIN